MDRDVSANTPSAPDPSPPVPWPFTRKVALAGLGLTVVAAFLGLVVAALGSEAPWPLNTARLALVFVGSVIAGLALSFRSDLWQSWVLSGATGIAAVVGTPAHWDSFRLLFGVLTAVAALGAITVAAPTRWRYRILSAVLLFHFFGIFMATTSPPPSPWLTEQLYSRIYNPYLHFLHLRNAYHFYSPEPGPASLLAILLRTEVGEEIRPDGTRVPKYEYKWVVFPRRPADIRDPLGLTYYRRLALTEQTAQTVFLSEEWWQTPEAEDVVGRRRSVTQPGTLPTQIPLPPQWGGHYRVPRPDVTRYVLPSYAQHAILENVSPDKVGRTTAKIYRLEHRIISVQDLLGSPPLIPPMDPYHPATYRPYFLGEFGFVPDPTATPDPTTGKQPTRITLLKPQDPMLYWVVPVIPRSGAKKDYSDYFSAHALEVPVGNLDQEPYASRSFNWSQLR